MKQQLFGWGMAIFAGIYLYACIEFLRKYNVDQKRLGRMITAEAPVDKKRLQLDSLDELDKKVATKLQ